MNLVVEGSFVKHPGSLGRAPPVLALRVLHLDAQGAVRAVTSVVAQEHVEGRAVVEVVLLRPRRPLDVDLRHGDGLPEPPAHELARERGLGAEGEEEVERDVLAPQHVRVERGVTRRMPRVDARKETLPGEVEVAPR